MAFYKVCTSQLPIGSKRTRDKDIKMNLLPAWQVYDYRQATICPDYRPLALTEAGKTDPSWNEHTDGASHTSGLSNKKYRKGQPQSHRIGAEKQLRRLIRTVVSGIVCSQHAICWFTAYSVIIKGCVGGGEASGPSLRDTFMCKNTKQNIFY